VKGKKLMIQPKVIFIDYVADGKIPIFFFSSFELLHKVKMDCACRSDRRYNKHVCEFGGKLEGGKILIRR